LLSGIRASKTGSNESIGKSSQTKQLLPFIANRKIEARERKENRMQLLKATTLLLAVGAVAGQDGNQFADYQPGPGSKFTMRLIFSLLLVVPSPSTSPNPPPVYP